MENENKPKSRVKHPDRVTLSPETLSRLRAWLVELEGPMKGSRINKNDLVNFLVLSLSASLSEREVESLVSQHFDEVRFAEWALKRIKIERAEGKSTSLSEVIGLGALTKQKGGHDGNGTSKTGK